MGHNQKGVPRLAEVHHSVEAFLLKCPIADAEDFVDNQQVRIEVCGDRECKTHDHPTGVRSKRFMDEISEFGKLHNLIE